jgi:hypothetical protein
MKIEVESNQWKESPGAGDSLQAFGRSVNIPE